MAKTSFICEGSTANNSLTRYFAIGGSSSLDSVETYSVLTMRSAGTFSDFKMYVSANNLDSGSSVFTFRKDTGGGAADGNLTITVGFGTTGLFQDTTHSDSVSSGDKVNYKVVTTGSSGGTTFRIPSLSFAASTNTVIKYCAPSDGNQNSTNPIYVAINTLSQNASQSTETPVEIKFRTAGTLQNGFVNIKANTKAVTTTYRLRKNNSDGNISMSVLTTATGIHEDTSNTDSVSAGDLIAWSISSNTSNQITNKGLSVEFVTTNSTSEMVSGNVNNGGQAIAAGTTTYFGLNCYPTPNTTEANRQFTTPYAFTASNLSIKIQANAATTDGTFDIRQDTGSGPSSTALTVSLTALTTGWFEDTTHTVSVAINDKLNARIVTGATGSTTIGSFGLVSTQSATLVSTMMFMGMGT